MTQDTSSKVPQHRFLQPKWESGSDTVVVGVQWYCLWGVLRHSFILVLIISRRIFFFLLMNVSMGTPYAHIQLFNLPTIEVMWDHLAKTKLIITRFTVPTKITKKPNAQDSGFQDNGHQSLKESESMENRNNKMSYTIVLVY